DDHGESLQVLAPLFNNYGGNTEFAGPVVTLKVFEDNTLVREALEEAGAGRVLVVDGGGSLRCALVGDNIAELARANGWAGVVVYGCIRDAAQMGQMPVGVKALNTNPRKSVKKGVGDRDIPVRFADALIEPGSYLYADADGIVVAAEKLD
ncbi:MAG: ribonuclease E activity regulator RraA, partial [Gammaproteobacteria bacterium]|nr:ribonuclease E activity regulator RraA [Gammaproteobacteria bacterium]